MTAPSPILLEWEQGMLSGATPSLRALAAQLAGGGGVGGFVTVNGSATADDTWAGKNIVVSASANCTITIPNSLSAAWWCSVLTINVIQVTFAASGGAVLRNAYSHTKSNGTPYDPVTVARISATDFNLVGATGI